MRVFKIALSLLLLYNLNLFGKIDGTTGIPLGGIGTGAVKYNASNGTFTANFRTPTRNGDYQLFDGAQFQIFTKRGNNVLTAETLAAQQNNGRVDDDAIFPLHRVNFGDWNGVSVEMIAYMPFDPQSISMMCHPCAIFEFTLNNSQNDSVIAALAFQIRTPIVPTAIADKGFVAKASSLELCLFGAIPDGTGDLSYGSDNGFFTTGFCNNQFSGTENRLALRISLNPAELKSLRFVLAWYQPDEIEHYQYTQYWTNAQQVAVSAINNFDLFEENAQELVSRMRASNLPSWLVDQTLNSLINLVNNSVYFQDGRYCHTEGQWHPEGTMDQMWHARQIYTMINPELAWQELKWWARTQHVHNYPGQIHHDFGTNFNYVGWDDTEHPDYRPIYQWVDLNCGFIISVYEAFIATADQTELTYFWPYVKKAAQRILNQVNAYGSTQYPYTFSTSLSTYDAGGNSQAYNTGLSIVTYRIMIYLAEIMGEPQTSLLYQDAFDKAVNGFEDRWLDNPYPVGEYCESVLGPLWIANFFKMAPFWEKQKIDNLFKTITDYYDPLNNGMGHINGSYSEWQPYLVGHLGGYSLQTNRSKVWLALQRDMYERNYFNRDLVFNQQLGIPAKVISPKWIATSARGTNQYISIPVLWRNYYNLIGFHRNKYSGELWLEPMLFDSLNHHLQNALILTPEGYGTISYRTYGDSYQNQEIVFQPDQPMDVSALYIWDLYADSLSSVKIVRVNDVDTDFLRTGNGDQTHLKLNWTGTIPVDGITVQVEGEPRPDIIKPSVPDSLQGNALGPSQILLTWRATSEGIIGYIVEINLGGTFQTLGTTTSSDTFYLDTGLLTSTAYTYRVRSYNAQYLSDPCTEIVVTTKEDGTGELIHALNAGGITYLSTSGIQYINDASTGWVSGGNTYSTTDAIVGTQDDELYQSERYGNFNYAIPVDNGLYDVVLKFAEIYQTEPNARIFHVDIEGERVIRNLDLIFRTGRDKAYDVVIPLELTDEILNIDFITVNDNAKVSALEVRRRNGVGLDKFRFVEIPASYILDQNYPNPFNPVTHIQYGLPKASQVRMTLYNALGEQVAVLIDERKQAGYHLVDFNASNLASGTYFYHIKTEEFQAIKKMILLR